MLVAVLMAFVMVATSASAAAGWQVLGGDGANFYNYTYASNMKSGKVFTSLDHGNVGINVLSSSNVVKTNGQTPIAQIQVFEDDGATGDDHIATFYYYPLSTGNQLFQVDVDAYRDGANGKAEIQVRYTGNYQGSVYANILD